MLSRTLSELHSLYSHIKRLYTHLCACHISVAYVVQKKCDFTLNISLASQQRFFPAENSWNQNFIFQMRMLTKIIIDGIDQLHGKSVT